MPKNVLRTAAPFFAPFLLACSAALGYNPPVDAAGPLSVRIEGPDEVTKLETPTPVQVVLENRSEKAIQGTIEVTGVDRWRVDPAGRVTFFLGGRQVDRRVFHVTAGKGTYAAHYPIHAFVRFQADGQTLTAHPVLVLQAKVPQPPRVQDPIQWKPFRLGENSQLALWRLPVFRVIGAVFGETPQVMPVGWQGSEPRTGGSFRVQPYARIGSPPVAHDALAFHPPWQKGLVGTVLVEYPLELPKRGPIRLKFAHAMTPEGQSDGVTFRVRAVPIDAPAGQLGKVLFERHSAAKQWTAAEADLSSLAGQAVRLQLEAHPGPKHDTGWDANLWAEPTLVAGQPPENPMLSSKEEGKAKRLGRVGRGETTFDVQVRPSWRGLLDSKVSFTAPGGELWFQGFEIRVLGQRLDDSRSPIVLKEVKEEPADGLQMRHRFESDAGPFDLVVRLFVEQGVLRARFKLENAPAPKPWLRVHLEDVACGRWSGAPSQVYAGEGNVMRRPGAFRLGFDGHQLSTSFVGMDFGKTSIVQGVDVPPDHFESDPDGWRCSLHVPHDQTVTFIPAANVWDAVKGWRETNGLKAAGGVEKAAGRFVFDLWGGRYADLDQSLRRAFRYGLVDSMVIVHDWQRWGYDYRLPDIFPPSAQLGTLADMRQLLKTCKDRGVPAAVHDNYIDFYPDAEGFSYEQNIAFQADGTPVRAWLNEWRKAQSYRFRADRVAPYLQRNLKLIRDEMGPTAYFIDVWSSIGPYDYWTADGKFYDRVYTRTSWGEHFAWIRNLLDGGPQISESGHDQLIGWLDGSQANHLRVGKPGDRKDYGSWCVWDIPHGDAERTPWFDAAHHDRFIQHGAGYPSRYEGGLDPKLHGIYSDDYISTEVLTGHPAMVPAAFNRQVVRKYWLLHDVMRALALRWIEGVEYAEGDLHRQHVRWSDGGEVWVNRGASDWVLPAATLPQYGFLATIPTAKGPVRAAIARQEGVLVETASSPDRLYVNGREVIDDALPIRVSVQEARRRGDRGMEFSFQWQADAAIPAGWTPFLHFCDDAGEIVFQTSHVPGKFETERRGAFSATASTTIPEKLKPGDAVELRAGIYNPKTGERLQLAGPDDGTRRIRLGKLRLDGQGGRVTAIAWAPHRPEPDPALARQNPANRPIDFGPVVTSGAFRLAPEGTSLVVTPLPERHGKTSEIRIRWAKLAWKLPEPREVEFLAEDGRVLGREPIRREADAIVLICRPDVHACRLVP